MPRLIIERHGGKEARFPNAGGAFYVYQHFLAEQHVQAILQQGLHVYLDF